MIDKPLRTAKAIVNDELQVVYSLIFRNAYYSLEGRIEGSSPEDAGHYCFVENFTDDEGEAEMFLKRLVKGKVYPVHIKDLAEDFFLHR